MRQLFFGIIFQDFENLFSPFRFLALSCQPVETQQETNNKTKVPDQNEVQNFRLLMLNKKR
ncbi:hypothetical protein BpHYR1_011933 [Brachionus plicatilis]|uniref:Uncharacterized protein n=1 Tax=Brachionus plicatilis TaxID=10195 RepID=A0A3M7SMP2_BRAPC|nr:hypothetical protein BpHYR1_011933 [Brachionus plicatilis]